MLTLQSLDFKASFFRLQKPVADLFHFFDLHMHEGHGTFGFGDWSISR